MFLLIGIAAGALTGVPIGPANVAVIDAAYRHTLRRALAVSAGAALADGLYAAGGVLGVTPLLRAYPSIPPILFAISGVVLLIYGFLTARSQPVQPAAQPPHRPSDTGMIRKEQRREMWSGFTVGLALILLNPAAIVTWVVIMGSMIPIETTGEGLACAIGVMVGSAGWFALVAYLTQKGKNVLGDKAQWIPRVVGMFLMVYAVYLLAKAVKYVIA
ncbi:MAG: LysE family transporter [Kofleriaceae bacterium]|nr:LysE family transporter [Kofleriaceae bacterium]